MQSHLHGSWHSTIHRAEIRHDFDRANGPGVLRTKPNSADQPKRTLATRMLASLGALRTVASGRFGWSLTSRPQVVDGR